jgi:P4 family phage/plasmid primase-like protien
MLQLYPIESRLRELESVAGLGRVFIAVHHVKKDGACTCGRETCDSQGKHPIDRGWQAPGAQYPASAVERWFRDGRNAGIVTGAETGLLLLDLDNEDAVVWFEERNQDAPFFMVRTGRGAHVYYKHPGWDVRNSAGALAPGVDVRGERGFVVAPGSIHRNGRMYAVDTESQDDPQPVPGWLDEALKQASRPRAQAPQTRTDADGLIREGGRNEAVFKIASSLRAQGLGYEAILASLRATNETAVVPPLEDRVLVDIAERVVDGYQAGTPARRIKIGLASGLKVEQPEGDDKKGVQPDDIARAYIEATADKPVVLHRGFWFAFNGQCYDRTTDDDIAHSVLARMQQAPELVSKCKRAFVGDVVANLASRVRIPNEIELGGWTSVDGPLSIVARNGIVDVDAYLAERDDWLKPHDPDLLATVCLPFEVDPEADCPLWMSVLEKIMPDEETRTRLQQWFGLNMVPDISHQLAAILVGDGSNGKSTVLEILGDLVGRGNYSTVPLERFGERFDLAAMVGKSANIAHEMGEIDKAAEGVLKQLISGEEMTFERKHKDPYQARPTARLTFSTNVLPRFADRTDAIWRRLLIFPFNVKIRQEEKDYSILDKLRAELPGIFNWAIYGLELLKAHGIGESLEMSNTKARYREAVNPFLQWVDDRIDDTGLGTVETAKLHEDYRSWCGTNGYHPLAARTFESELERHFRRTVSRPRDNGGARPRVFPGLRIVR